MGFIGAAAEMAASAKIESLRVQIRDQLGRNAELDTARWGNDIDIRGKAGRRFYETELDTEDGQPVLIDVALVEDIQRLSGATLDADGRLDATSYMKELGEDIVQWAREELVDVKFIVKRETVDDPRPFYAKERTFEDPEAWAWKVSVRFTWPQQTDQ